MKTKVNGYIKNSAKAIIITTLWISANAWAEETSNIEWSNQAKCSVTFLAADPNSDDLADIPEQSKLIEMEPVRKDNNTGIDNRSGSIIFSLGDFQVKIKTGFLKRSKSKHPIFTTQIEFLKSGKILSSTNQTTYAVSDLGIANYSTMMNILDITNPEVANELAKLPANNGMNFPIAHVARSLYPQAEHAVFSVSTTCATSNIKQIKID